MAEEAEVDAVDLTGVADPSLNLGWRAHAIELAVQHHLVGQVQRTGRNIKNFYGMALVELRCTSATEPTDHQVIYNVETQAVSCDCTAGEHPRRGPCGHVGAALLLMAGLAPERKRP